jgi:hypothetical protein
MTPPAIERCSACGRLITGPAGDRRRLNLSMDAVITDCRDRVVYRRTVFAPELFVGTSLPACNDVCAMAALEQALGEPDGSRPRGDRDTEEPGWGWLAFVIALACGVIYWIWF